LDGVQLSLVVPAWNEAVLLPRLWSSLATARSRAINPAAIEFIVADNGSTDATAQIARDAGCVVAPVEKRCIAAVRNGGARVATGEYLAFVDADSIVHPDCFSAIIAALDDPGVIGGATGVTMERWSPGIALSYALVLPMVWVTGFDTGIVFCRRVDFEFLGGYDESRVIAEDVDFLVRLRRLGRSRGQSLRRLRGVKTVTSTRKFDRHGDWHYFLQMPRVAWNALRRTETGNAFIRRYWYEDR